MYGHRLWAAPGHFGPDDVDFMTEPFADADKLRASWGSLRDRLPATGPWRTCPSCSSRARSPRSCSTAPRTTWCPPSFPDRARVAFTECVGPFVVPDAGHFLQWEQADVLNRALAHFCR